MGFNKFDDEDTEGTNVNVVDSENPANKQKVTSEGEALNQDIIQTEGTQGALTVGTSSVEVKVGANRLANRKSVTIYNNSSRDVFWGYTSGVTATTGTPIKRNEFAVFRVSDQVTLYVIAASANNDVRITEAF